MTTSLIGAILTFLLFVVATWSPSVGPEGSAVLELLRYLLVLVASGAIILTAQFSGRLKIAMAPEWVLLLAFLFYTALSSLWSEGDLSAAIKAGLIISTTVTCVAMACIVRLPDIIGIFYLSKSLFLVLSFIAVYVSPTTSIESGWLLDGEWSGIFSQKNGLGATAAFAVVAALAVPLPRFDRLDLRYLALCSRIGMFAIAAVCLYMAGSRGAMALAAVGLTALAISRLPKSLQRLGLLASAIASILLVNLVASTVELSADDISLAGITIDTNSRTILWSYGLQALEGREFLGFGVDGFWTPDRIAAFKAVNGWVLDNFHNGYVTILVEGGLIGIMLLFAAITAILFLFTLAIGNVRDWSVSVAFAWTSMFLIGDLVENGIGRSTSSSFILFIVLSLALRNHLALKHVERPAGRPVPMSGHQMRFRNG